MRAILLVELLFFSIFTFQTVQLYKSQHHCLQPKGNHYAFWLSSLAFREQINPYEVEETADLACKKHGLCFSAPEEVWSLPLIFPLISWYSLLTFEDFVALSVFSSSILLYLSLIILSVRFNFYHDRKRHFLSRLFFISSIPVYFTITCGLFLPVILLALTSFLWLTKETKTTNSFGAGLTLAITIIKPHPLFFLNLFVLLQSLIRKSFASIFGLITGALLLFLSTYSLFPEIFTFYFGHLQSFPITYLTPTLISNIIYLSDQSFERTMIYFLFFVVLYLYLFWRGRWQLEQEYFVFFSIVYSLIATPYLWPYEFVFLLPVALYLIAKVKDSKLYQMFLILLGINLLMLFTFSKVTAMHFNTWYPISFLFVLLFRKQLGCAK